MQQRLNIHQLHLDSLCFTGEDGLNEIQYYLDNLLTDNVTLSQKIDGSPSVIIWSHFEGYPDNSICLKSFVNNNNNVLSSQEEIEDKYSSRPEMYTKLLACLKLAKCIPSGEAWQGDCLFTQNSLKNINILGKDYLTFQPNKVIYAISEDQESYKKIAKSSFGICFHTIYTGNLEHKKQSFKVNLDRLNNVPNDIYLMSPLLNKPKDNLDIIKPLYNRFINLKVQLEANSKYNELLENPVFKKYWSLFENKFISDRAVTTLDLTTFEADLNEFIKDRLEVEYNKKLDTLKTDKGKERAEQTYQQGLRDLENIDKATLRTVVNCFNIVAEIKMKLLSILPTNTEFSTFFNSVSQGYIPTAGEGISMSDSEGNITKIVDRSTFSNANRSSDILRGFEENLNERLEKPSKTAVVAFGRFNPPTKAHKMLTELVVKTAKENNADPLLFLSHSCDKKKNPLDYETKLKYCREAFPEITIVNSEAKTLVNVLEELNKDYTDIIYVCGTDRLQGTYSTDKVLTAYNNKPDKSGKINYAYNSINFVSAGERKNDGTEMESISASKARELAKNGDFTSFQTIVPFEAPRARQLFNDVRLGLGLEKINEELSDNNIIKIRQQIAGILSQNPNVFIVESTKNHRHPSQLLRIRLDLNNQEKALQEVSETLQNLSIDSYKYVDYGYHSGASGQFNSFEILLDEVPYYITVSTKINKELTPVKLMNHISGKLIDYKNIANLIKYNKDSDIENLLQELANSAASQVDCKQLVSLQDNLIEGTANDISFEFKSDMIASMIANLGEDKFKLVKNSLEVDFAEIYGAIALAHLVDYCLGTNVSIQYPSKANERLIDYTLVPSNTSYVQDLKVSAKTKSGASPSSISMFESIRNLLNSGYTNSDLAAGINFSSWFIKEYLSKGTDEGYSFLAECMVDIAKGQGPKWSVELDTHSEFKTIADCISGKVNKNKCLLIREACNSILSNYEGHNVIREPGKLYEDHWDKYIIRCLGTVLVTLINNSEIIDQVNLLFRYSYGSLIQVYTFPNFEKGEFKFIAKWITDGDHKYYFNYNIGLDTASRTFKNNKLAIVAK